MTKVFTYREITDAVEGNVAYFLQMAKEHRLNKSSHMAMALEHGAIAAFNTWKSIVGVHSTASDRGHFVALLSQHEPNLLFEDEKKNFIAKTISMDEEHIKRVLMETLASMVASGTDRNLITKVLNEFLD